MRFYLTVTAAAVLLGCGGCANPPTPNSRATAPTNVFVPPAAAFLDEKKSVPARMEWIREITNTTGGFVNYKIAAPGPFSVIVITDKGLQAMKARSGKDIIKKEILQIADGTAAGHEDSVVVPPGSAHFIIENQTDKIAEIHLQCFAGAAARSPSLTQSPALTPPTAPAAPPAPAIAALIDEKKTIPARMEWIREVTTLSSGNITFKVAAPGAFSVIVITDRGLKAMQSDGAKSVIKGEMLHVAEGNSAGYEGKVFLPTGSAHFIIENQTAKPAEVHLQCFPPKT